MKKHFNMKASCNTARAGELATPHGTVATPVFLPVGSQATVRTLTPQDIRDIGFDMVLANTYHLYLRPGIDVIRGLGGLHRFMAWDGALLTDSGGYQVFSLAPFCRIDDDGVRFRSHIDGSEHFLTPGLAVAYQEALGADVIMALDECTAYGDPPEKVREAMHRTHRWAERCLKAQQRPDLALYAIVQGGTFPDLRRESAEYLTSLDFPGYAVGGLSVGEPKEVTWATLEETVPRLPGDKPRYLMGVGAPEDIVAGVARGVDIFDCALPTRVARNGALFTGRGRVNIRRAAYARMDAPLDPACDCSTCRTFSAAYLSHLFRSGELLGLRLATVHNLRFIYNLMKNIREAIIDGTFDSFRKDFLDTYHTTDEETRVAQKKKWLRGREKEGG
ncbi:MAG: tRNA guanosine(34) transglycosylase Tgt [Chloroflexi bacterium RBG_16_60_22]|nr:MAG: tRNA guanosine(34) transglycosylase Tgt [Chloroflexi bacterium RBG_16_60_22]